MELKYMETITTVVIALITAVVGPATLEWVRVKLKKDVMPDPIRNELESAKIIDEDIEDMREYLNADRIWVSMFHNGGHFLHSNKSIQKFSIMYEASKNGVSKIAPTFTNIPVSLFLKSNEEILNSGHIFISNFDDETQATFGLKEAATASGAKATYAVGLFDIKTEICIGTLGIDYLTTKKLTIDQKSFLIERCNRLSGYISIFLKS
jgi:hypothetical protein